MEDFLHLHRNPFNRSFSVFLLFIPAIIFVLVLAYFLSQKPLNSVATIEQPTVLGTESEGP
jgi:hypothetical protein